MKGEKMDRKRREWRKRKKARIENLSSGEILTDNLRETGAFVLISSDLRRLGYMYISRVALHYCGMTVLCWAFILIHPQCQPRGRDAFELFPSTALTYSHWRSAVIEFSLIIMFLQTLLNVSSAANVESSKMRISLQGDLVPGSLCNLPRTLHSNRTGGQAPDSLLSYGWWRLGSRSLCFIVHLGACGWLCKLVCTAVSDW